VSTVATRLAAAESAMQRACPNEKTPEQAAFLTETLRIFEHIWTTGEPPADAQSDALEIVLRLDARV
jgi:hypothetical protein